MLNVLEYLKVIYLNCWEIDMHRTEMEFTGERVVPGKTPPEIYREHIDRYIFAGGYIKDKDILDVACGAGYGIDHMIKAGARSAIGVDISMESTRYAKDWYDSGNGVCFICADGINLPFVDNVVDIITSFETIEHVEQYDRLLAEFNRVLKVDGLLICSTPNKRIFSPNDEKPPNTYHVKEFWPDEFEELLRGTFSDVTLYGQCDVNFSDNSVERDRGVHEFVDNEILSSGYVVAVAKKGIRSRF